LFVCDLMIAGEHRWDATKLDSLFLAETMAFILDTTMFDSVLNYKIMWMKEQHGMYIVKSVYRLAMTELLHTQRFHVEGEWSRLWKVNAPHKARNLLWGIIRGCAPTRSKLQARHVQCDLACSWCGTDAETDFHVVAGCTVAHTRELVLGRIVFCFVATSMTRY